MTALPVVTSPLLELPGVRHAFFTRQGGVSTGIYAGLNAGPGSNDDPAAVAENRARAAAHLDAAPAALAVCHQIHSARVATTLTPFGEDRPQADGVATATPGVVCGALAADCAPVLLADAEAGVVAAVHAGWKGALAGVVEAGVAAMAGLGARPARIRAAVGPCIAQASYEVGLDFLAAFEAADPDFARFFAPGETEEKRQFDLPAFVLSRLAAAGVGKAEWVGLDTCADPERFYSNRRAFRRGEADYGRLLSAIVLS